MGGGKGGGKGREGGGVSQARTEYSHTQLRDVVYATPKYERLPMSPLIGCVKTSPRGVKHNIKVVKRILTE